MKTESKQVYKFFENKPILVITISNFKYHTSNLHVLDDSVFFTDNRQQQILLKFSEIKFIQEVLQ
jgi:hypothetical protein